ncbi:MAG TPA: SDR family oxidoreductase [Bryobacteraceae bacterium]|jgi:NAD(P)-dependent dehydrogenase (short-subunit alcohol dehydrogenase family)|nr:SDR family oxidoreductase [Bryobacteraceae bacterium]
MTDNFRLDGKTALITGGASGIGRSIASRFTGVGAQALIVDVDKARAEQTAAEIAGSKPFACDITDSAQVNQLFTRIASLDILINCAGIGLVGSITETEELDLQRLFRVNVEGTFLVTKAALPLLLKSHGSIINMGSVAGMVGVKRRFAYCATKGAVHAITRQLAVDYPTELRVNCIAPGTVDTPFVEGYLEKYHRHEKDKVRAELNQRQPMGRLAQPDEIADLAVYISSPAAAFMNGSVVTIDGGWTAA